MSTERDELPKTPLTPMWEAMGCADVTNDPFYDDIKRPSAGIPALLEPIQERLDASGRQWGVQHKTFTNGDYDRTFESDWNFKPFTQDSAMELAESMNRSKPVQIARAAFREVGEWTPEGNEDAPTDQARLLAAVQAVTGIAGIKMNSEHGDPAFVQGWEAAIEELNARIVAALGGEA